MRMLSPIQQRWLKLLHIVFAAMWMGGGLSLCLILFFSRPQNGDELYAANRAMQIVDDMVIVPGAMGGLFTGLIFSVWTRWGFFKHGWVTIKWMMTLAQAILGTFLLGPWLNDNVDIARLERIAALDNPIFAANQHKTMVWGTLQVALIGVMMGISVIKPVLRGSAPQAARTSSRPPCQGPCADSQTPTRPG